MYISLADSAPSSYPAVGFYVCNFDFLFFEVRLFTITKMQKAPSTYVNLPLSSTAQVTALVTNNYYSSMQFR